MLSEHSKRIRYGGVGSSDVAAIVGVDPHRGAIDVFLQKLGIATVKQTDAMESGHELESPIGRMYCRRFGARLHSGGGTIRHREHAWAVATIDRRANPGPAKVVEIKNVGAYMMHAWREGPPTHTVVQVEWQLFVADLPSAHIAALLGGTTLKFWYIDHDPELSDMLFVECRAFWMDRVVPARKALEGGSDEWMAFAPEHTPAEAVDMLDAAHPDSNGCVLEPTAEAHAAWRALGAADDELERAKAQHAGAEAAAKKLIGKADGIEGLFSWKTDKAGRVAWAQVAKALKPPRELVEQFTSAPGRRFLRLGKEGKKS